MIKTVFALAVLCLPIHVEAAKPKGSSISHAVRHQTASVTAASRRHASFSASALGAKQSLIFKRAQYNNELDTTSDVKRRHQLLVRIAELTTAIDAMR